MKLNIDGKEILSVDIDDDERSVDNLQYSDYFESLPMDKQIEILSDHGRQVERELELFKNPRRLKTITSTDIYTGKQTELNEKELFIWLGMVKILIASLKGESLPMNPEDLFDTITAMTLKGH